MKVKLDQHMMIDQDIIKEIVRLADIKKTETILEIGAGSGNLTKQLAAKSASVIAIEIDDKFKKQLRELRNIKLIIGNALQKIDDLSFNKIVSNIPYAICEPLLHKLFKARFGLAVLTVPDGFAKILVAKKNQEFYSRLSLIAQTFFEIEIVLELRREAFDPPPETDSVVVMIKPRAENIVKKEVLKREKLKVKNAIIRALYISLEMDKNEAKKAIKTLKLNKLLLEKRLKDLDLKELDTVLTRIQTF